MPADERQSQRQATGVTGVVWLSPASPASLAYDGSLRQAQQHSQATSPDTGRRDSPAAGDRVSQSSIASRSEGRRSRRVREDSRGQNPQPSSTSDSESSGCSEDAEHRSSGSTANSEDSHASSASLRDLRDELQYRDETISFLHAYIAFMAPGPPSAPPPPPSSAADQNGARPVAVDMTRHASSGSLLLPITVRKEAYAAAHSGSPQ